MPPDCFICRKHTGQEAQPPGGYIYEDANWKTGHARAQMAGLGTLVVESARHFLDFAEMTPDESLSFGVLMTKLYTCLKAETEAELVYTVLYMEGIPHFHAWLVPRYKNGTVRGLALLEKSQCDETAAVRLAGALRTRLAT